MAAVNWKAVALDMFERVEDEHNEFFPGEGLDVTERLTRYGEEDHPRPTMQRFSIAPSIRICLESMADQILRDLSTLPHDAFPPEGTVLALFTAARELKEELDR